jgi:UDP-N-acetylglucosamine 2-epimerase
MKKTVVTITGIRPDFIRMSQIFKKLDENFEHILIHTGQHFNHLLSDVFFDELDIRKPDYNLEIGGYGKEHFHQTSELSVKIIELFRTKNIKPDLIIFLGDSNSVVCSVPLKKEGYKIAHIEAGMRSGDKRMLEEINRIVCDHCSDFLFVYHENYLKKLEMENIKNNVYVVGNTIVEVVNKYKPTEPKKNDLILLDIHRPENFKHKKRLENIIKFANQIGEIYNLPVFMLNFPRTTEFINDFNIDIGNITLIDLLSFKNYINKVYHSKLLISDSGTAQEEPVFLGTPVLVPRDFTERPESVKNKCSYMVDVNELNNSSLQECIEWVQNEFIKNNKDWLGNGTTSEKIIEILKREL